MAHWDVFRPDDRAYEVQLSLNPKEERTSPLPAVQIPQRLVLEVLRLAREHQLSQLARLPETAGASWTYPQEQFHRLEEEWAALRELLRDPQIEEAFDPVFALVEHAYADLRAWFLVVRAP